MIRYRQRGKEVCQMKMKKLIVREAESLQTTAAALYCESCC